MVKVRLIPVPHSPSFSVRHSPITVRQIPFPLYRRQRPVLDQLSLHFLTLVLSSLLLLLLLSGTFVVITSRDGRELLAGEHAVNVVDRADVLQASGSPDRIQLRTGAMLSAEGRQVRVAAVLGLLP